MVQRDERAMGIDPYAKGLPGGLLGKSDIDNRDRGSAYYKLPVGLWSRQELYNRVRWLKGEITRLMLKQHSKWSRWKTDVERLHELQNRKFQLTKYQSAMDKYEAMHKRIVSENRNSNKRKVRAIAKKLEHRQLWRLLRCTSTAFSDRLYEATSPIWPKAPRKRQYAYEAWETDSFDLAGYAHALADPHASDAVKDKALYYTPGILSRYHGRVGTGGRRYWWDQKDDLYVTVTEPCRKPLVLAA
jgi:hypothetical protein